MNPKVAQSDHAGRLSLIDAIRALAVMAVVLFHVFPASVPGGFIGVDIFFTISGFVIALNYLDPLVRGEIGFAAFFLRRLRRLVPAYLIALAATTVAAIVVMVPKDLANFGESLAAQAIYLQNVAFWKQGDYFDDPLVKPLLHTWSLAVEEQFYLLFPMLIFIFKWRFHYGTFTLLILTVTSVILGFYFQSISASAVFFMLPFRVWEFTIGIIAALVFPIIKSLRISPALGSVIAIFGLVTLVFSIAAFDETSLFPSLQATIAVTGVFVLIFAEPHVGPRLRRISELAPIQHFGRISYSWYLWHWPVVAIYFIYVGRSSTFGEATLLLLLGYILGAASYQLIEVPGMRWPWLRQTGRTLGLLAAFVGFAILVGLFLTQSRGWIDRYQGRERQLYAAQMDRPPYRCPVVRRLISLNSFCQINDVDGNRGILLIGDSHADMVKPAFASMATAAGRPFYLTKKSCRLVAKGMKGACGSSILRDVVNEVRRGHISDVIVIGRYAEAFDATSYNRSVRTMTNAGTNVTIVTSNPESESFDPAYWIRLGRMQDWPITASYSRNAYERDQSRQLAVMRELARHNSNVTLIEPYRVLCPDQCIVAVGDRLLYHDKHHLTSTGVSTIAPLFSGLFERSKS